MSPYIRALVLMVALEPVAVACAGESPVEGDLARLQGRWVTRAGARRNIVVVLDVEGRSAKVDITTPQGLKFHATGELRINESVAPRALDWVGFSGLDSQDLPDIPAIYEISGETFKVCNGGPNSARPSEFKPGENILADIHVFEQYLKPARLPPGAIEARRRGRPFFRGIAGRQSVRYDGEALAATGRRGVAGQGRPPLLLRRSRPIEGLVALFLQPALVCLVLAQVAPAEVRVRTDLKPAADVKASFLAMLDRPRVPLDVRSEPAETDAKTGLTVERLSFASEKKADGTIERVPVLIVRPQTKAGESGKRPAVIALHGTGGTKDGMRSWLDQLAGRGVVGVAIDARYHGDRAGGAKGSAAYVEAITRAWKTRAGEPLEHPFYYDTCWDLWRTLDYLETRDDIDPKQLGMLGISMGGIETWLAGAVDNRVKVAVPAIGVQSFRWSLENEVWQGRANTIRGAHEAAAKDLGQEKVNAVVCRDLWNKVIPGMLGAYDCPSMIRLFAGRPLLILNGEKDLNCPIGGARIAIASAEQAFNDAGASDRLKVMIAPGVGHTVTPEQHDAAIEWFVPLGSSPDPPSESLAFSLPPTPVAGSPSCCAPDCRSPSLSRCWRCGPRRVKSSPSRRIRSASPRSTPRSIETRRGS